MGFPVRYQEVIGSGPLLRWRPLPIGVSCRKYRGATGSKHMTAMLDDEVADPDAANAELRRRLSEALAERDEAEAKTAALAEVLEVINSSPGDLAPVFEAMLDKAMRLCEARFGLLRGFDGER